MTVRSVLIDITTNLPITGAHVFLKNDSTIGMASFDDGSFQINAEPHQSIVVSHLNYGQYVFKAHEITGTTYLVPLTSELDEVEIIGDKEKPNWLKIGGIGLLALLLIRSFTDKPNNKKLGKPVTVKAVL